MPIVLGIEQDCLGSVMELLYAGAELSDLQRIRVS